MRSLIIVSAPSASVRKRVMLTSIYCRTRGITAGLQANHARLAFDFGVISRQPVKEPARGAEDVQMSGCDITVPYMVWSFVAAFLIAAPTHWIREDHSAIIMRDEYKFLSVYCVVVVVAIIICYLPCRVRPLALFSPISISLGLLPDR